MMAVVAAVATITAIFIPITVGTGRDVIRILVVTGTVNAPTVAVIITLSIIPVGGNYRGVSRCWRKVIRHYRT